MKINLNAAPQLPFPNIPSHKNHSRVVWATYPSEMEVILGDDDNLRISGLKISIIQTKSQGGRLPNGYRVKQELREGDYAVLNATLLDFLLENQEFIPKHWQEKDVCIFFWGTEFVDPKGSECYRLMTWNGRNWTAEQYWPNCIWHSNYKAAVVEKP